MNKIKRYFFGVITSITMISPIFAAIACGTNPAKIMSITLKNGKEIRVKDKIFVGIRPEDTKLWNPIFSSFEKDTGIRVSPILAELSSYNIWDKTNNLPDVTITDSGAAVKGVLDGYFEPIDPKEVLGGDNFVIKSEENRTWGDNNYFDMPLYNSSHYVDKQGKKITDKLAMLPTIKGPSALTLWNKVGGIDLLDGKIPLKYFIPTTNSGNDKTVLTGKKYLTDKPTYAELKNYKGKSIDGKKIITFNLNNNNGRQSGDNIDILHDPIDGHRYMNTKDDIQKFINGAALYQQRRYFDQNKHIFPVGRYGLLQRLNSVGKTLSNYVNNDPKFSSVNKGNIGDWSGGKKFTGGINTGDLGAGWGFAWEKNIFDNNDISKKINIEDTAYDPISTIIEEREIFTRGMPKNGDNSYKISFSKDRANRNFSKTFLRIFYSGMPMGYQQTIDTKSLGVHNVMDAFSQQGTLGQIIPKWMVPSIFSKIHAKNPNNLSPIPSIQEALKDSSKYDLSLFSLPIFDTGVDGMALKKNNTTEESINSSKLFLRYLIKPEIAAKVAGDKTISLVKPAISLQPKSGDLSNYYINKAGSNSIIGKGSWDITHKDRLELKTIQQESDGKYPLVMVRSVSMNLASNFVEAGFHYEPSDPGSDAYWATNIYSKTTPWYSTGASAWYSYNKVLNYLMKNSPEFISKVDKLTMN